MLRNPGQHARSNLLVIVETEHIVSEIRMVELDVEALLGNNGPTFAFTLEEQSAPSHFAMRSR